jgi:hypothetical protein
LILERWQGDGVAELTALLNRADQAKDLIAFYAARGFRLVGGVDWPMTNFVSVVMSKSLIASNSSCE